MQLPLDRARHDKPGSAQSLDQMLSADLNKKDIITPRQPTCTSYV